jgi:hypothetical protein
MSVTMVVLVTACNPACRDVLGLINCFESRGSRARRPGGQEVTKIDKVYDMQNCELK